MFQHFSKMKTSIFFLLGIMGIWSYAAADSQIEGKVLLSSGSPVPGAKVRLFDLSDLSTASLMAVTNASGHFSLALTAQVEALPEKFELGENYPNPFNPSTIIPYRLLVAMHVRLEVFNILGQRIATLVDGEQEAGYHTAIWDATDASGNAVGSGVYLYRLTGNGTKITQSMVLIDGQVGIGSGGKEPTVRVGENSVEENGEAAPVYGLTVSALGLVPYVDPAFEVKAVTGLLNAVLEAPSSIPQAKPASGGVLGDVDNTGRVDFVDALLVAVYSMDASISIPNNGDISLGDVDSDGDVDHSDAQLISAHFRDPSNPGLPSGIGEPVVVINPDLIVESISVSDSILTPGQSFTLSAKVINQGTGPSDATTMAYYRSTESSISTQDSILNTGPAPSLAANETSEESISLTAPSSEGTYYYGACVASVSDESDTRNNCSAGIRVTVEAVTVATVPGQTLVLSASETTLRLGAAFAHPNSDVLTYSAFSADEGVTRVAMSGATLSISPVAEGATIVTVTATDSEGLEATLAFPVTVERLASRSHNIVLRVVHVTTDWMPFASWGGWPEAARPKESAALKYFEVAIWDETASVHLYEFDNNFKLWHDAGTDPARIAYREQYVVRKHSGMPSDWIARQDFVKSALVDFARYIAERFPDSDHHLIYSGHGGPGGRLFAGHLSQEGAAEFLGTWRAVLGRRLGVVDMGGPCNKGALSDLENFCGHARYYIASDLPNGGYTMDDWTIEKLDEIDPDKQYHALLARNADLETALKERIDLKRKEYEYSRQNMIAKKVEQANYLYSCTHFMLELGWNVQLFVEKSRGGGYGYGSDLWKYLTDNDAPKPLLEMFDHAIVHDANNRDFFPWEEVANGIMICCNY